ncbi:MAG: SLBB domain-containing protein [Clostridiales bacterium]|nr:SLBB domain-containing protein [Clostridiales bacterium]
MEKKPILALAEEVYRHTGTFSQADIQALAEEQGVPYAQLAGAVSFYALFSGGKLGEVTPCNVPEIPLTLEVRRILSQPGDYAGLKAALALSPDEILEAITASGLRGRGGAGFPTGLKWKTTKDCVSPVKYVVVNADEGEPDTAKDGAILRNVPHAVLEGMIICGLCVGASKGYVYIRGEYPEEKRLLDREVQRARHEGILGAHVCGTEFAFDVEIVAGAGSYVCGEETALLSSLEGQRGEPRLKPPFPGVAGLYQMPTVVNNTETIANVPLVLRLGAESYRQYGTEKTPGTKLVTVCGQVAQPGVYEVPLGTSLRSILDAVGYCQTTAKLIQVGGGASGCLLLPNSLDAATLDIEGMAAVGGTLGTGSVRVFGEDTDIVALCRDVAVFFQEESCGKCTPCRFGTKRIAELLELLAEGNGEAIYIAELRAIAAYMTDNARCAFGQSATGILLAALRLFPEEFEARCKGGHSAWNQ